MEQTAPETAPARLLVIDDDSDVVRLLRFHLNELGLEIDSKGTGQGGLDAVRAGTPQCVILDLGLPDRSGLEILDEIRAHDPEVPVLVLSAEGQLQSAVECMRRGANDYIQKPFEPVRLRTSLRNVLTQVELRERVAELARTVEAGPENPAGVIGRSASLTRAFGLLRRASESDVTILLLGESGSGKEVASRFVHNVSERVKRPFVALNCGAIPEALIESELFGHEKGAFTGADRTRKGCFEEASGGTLFLDEIGELPLDMQVKLLRVLQERQVKRVGSNEVHDVDVRVIAATNRDLEAEVEAGRVRRDLYYRLAVFPVTLPALRERQGDVALLADHFVRRFSEKHGKPTPRISAPALELMDEYSWPGNVRELENVVERAIILSEDGTIRPSELPTAMSSGASAGASPNEGESVIAEAANALEPSGPAAILPWAEHERRILRAALLATDWNVQETAARLEIGRATLYRKIDRFGLSRPS